MPRLVVPADQPEEMGQLIDVIGNRARAEILHRLAGDPRTAVDLAAEMGLAHSSVHRHLVRLESLGLVVADVEPGQRRGIKTVAWRSVPDRVREVGEEWVNYALGLGQDDSAT